MFKQYLTLAKVVGALALAAALVFGGCSFEKNRGAAQVAKLEGQVSALLDTTKRWEEIDKLNRESIENSQKAAAAWKKKAESAVERIAGAEKDKAVAERKARKALEEANKDPTCAELLRRQVCSVVPLP